MRALVLAVILLASPAATAEGFAGMWKTTFGPMALTVSGARVSGTYTFDGTAARLEGTVAGKRLTFRYTENAVRGEGWFELAADERSFAGSWREDGGAVWQAWTGTRTTAEAEGEGTFDGLWDSSFGRLRLKARGDRVTGLYNFGDGGTIDGKLVGRRLTFRYKEAEAAGSGWFELGQDGLAFRGQWTADGTTEIREWTGGRVVPEMGRTWLVVLEAYWEAGLADPPYAFGEMLEAFFRRVPKVGVRRRAFSDEDDLRRWGRELAFLAEPVVVVIATHASEKGLAVRGRTLGAAAIAEALRPGGTIALVHFSACAVMKDGLGEEILAKLAPMRLPLSGYTTSVDWAESAVAEMLYFEMILSRGMTPRDAAAQLLKMMPVAGDAKVPGAVWVPAGFRIVQ